VDGRAVLVDAEADLLDVEWTEALLDVDPPRARTVARGERPLHRAIGRLLERERRAELGPERRVVPGARRGVAEHTLSHGVVSARGARSGDAEVCELELAACGLHALGGDLEQPVRRHRAEAQPGVQERAAAAHDPQADAVDDDRRRGSEAEVAAGVLEHEHGQARRGAAKDVRPRAVDLDGDDEVATVQGDALPGVDGQPGPVYRGGAARVLRHLDLEVVKDRHARVGLGDVGGELQEPVDGLREVERASVEVGAPGEEHVLQQRLHRNGAEGGLGQEARQRRIGEGDVGQRRDDEAGDDGADVRRAVGVPVRLRCGREAHRRPEDQRGHQCVHVSAGGEREPEIGVRRRRRLVANGQVEEGRKLGRAERERLGGIDPDHRLEQAQSRAVEHDAGRADDPRSAHDELHAERDTELEARR
jgi:hypothetical protein